MIPNILLIPAIISLCFGFGFANDIKAQIRAIESREVQTQTDNEWPSTMASNSIPLIFINTENQQPILDKINYVQASAYIEVPDNQEQWNALASADQPVALEIRGRGNFSWSKTEKKAYKLKFNKKTSLLGMPANKHYALICYDMFYTSGWMAPYIGMELCRMVQPDWVPRMQPVEVVLNEEYRGIYLLVESIKLASDRLDMEVQDEGETNEDVIANGGWLVELDNQDDEFQIAVPCVNKNNTLRVTHKEPEILSDAQREWLIGEFTQLSRLIDYPSEFTNDNWENHFDLPSIARYMIIREYLHDIDGYSGSQYFHRSVGQDKWIAGPMWDLEIWPEKKPGWIRDYPRWSMMNWIPNMMKSEQLQNAFIKEWDEKYPMVQSRLFEFIDNVASVYEKAHKANATRWPGENQPISEIAEELKSNLSYNGEWIENNKKWDGLMIDTSLTVISSDNIIELTVSGDIMSIYSKENGLLRIYSSEGLLINSHLLSFGLNTIPIDRAAFKGRIAILVMDASDGFSLIRKIVL